MPNELSLVKFTVENNEFKTSKANYPLDSDGFLRFSVVEVPQGSTKFYTMSIYSDVLASLSYVIERSEDKVNGFQRFLNLEKAQDIADYIDNDGSIPTSIIVSAQPDIIEIDRRKSIKIKPDEFAFLVIDGQHRTYGFHLSKKRIRVPLVIYTNLSKDQEARLFIDVNAKQTKVPNDLLLEIVRLAKVETNQEALLNDLFEAFSTNVDSSLIGMLSGYPPEKGKLTRANLDSAIKIVLPRFGEIEAKYIYERLNPYIATFRKLLLELNIEESICRPNTLKTIVAIFPEVYSRAKFLSDAATPGIYEYSRVLRILSGNKQIVSLFRQPISSYKQVAEKIRRALNDDTVI